MYPPIQLSRDKRTCSPLVSHIESVCRPVVMFPVAKDITAAAVEIIIVLVITIVVTQRDVGDVSVAVAVGVVIALQWILVIIIAIVRCLGQSWLVV